MTYVVENSFDSRIPQTPKNSAPYLMVVCHDTEGGTGRAGALGTKSFLINRADRNASYHEMWWYHESTDEFGVLKIVPTSSAAHSVNPVPPPNGYYTPDSWVRTSLGSWWWDPNQVIYAVSIAGRIADVDRYATNPKFLAHAQRRMLELWAELGVNKRAEHFRFNPPPTRFDWGQNLMNALGGLVTPDVLPDTSMGSTTTTMQNLIPMTPTVFVIAPNTNIRTAPTLDPSTVHFNIGNQTPSVRMIAECQGASFNGSTRWLVYVIDTGGLRFVHEALCTKVGEMLDPGTVPPATDCTQAVAEAVAPLNTQIAAQQGEIATLNGAVEQQAGTIADLKTDLAMADQAAADALARAEGAEALVAPATELRDALRAFMG